MSVNWVETPANMITDVIHELKTIPPYFQWSWLKIKPFEVRKNDRGFQVFDVLVLKEYLPVSKEYTGRVIVARVTSIVEPYEGSIELGLKKGYCVMGVNEIARFTDNQYERSLWRKLTIL